MEWDAYDVVTADGVRIEVKSSAYLQAWTQRSLSKIVFTGLTARTWHPLTGYADSRTHNADVYVFCVQTATRHADYRPLDVDQWQFYVVSAASVTATGQRSLSLTRVAEIASESTSFADLREAIDRTAERRSPS